MIREGTMPDMTRPLRNWSHLTKHPGPDGAETHSTGSDQQVHGGCQHISTKRERAGGYHTSGRNAGKDIYREVLTQCGKPVAEGRKECPTHAKQTDASAAKWKAKLEGKRAMEAKRQGRSLVLGWEDASATQQQTDLGTVGAINTDLGEPEGKIGFTAEEVAARWHLPALPDGAAYWVQSTLLDAVTEKITTLNKKAKRLGLEPMGVKRFPGEASGFYWELDIPGIGWHRVSDETAEAARKRGDQDFLRKVERTFYPITITGEPPKAPGFRFVARIEHLQVEDSKDIINLFHKAPHNDDLAIPEMYRNRGPVCDFCKRNAYRRDTFLVYNQTSSEWVQLGRDDLKAYTGYKDPKEIIQWWSIYDELDGFIRDGNDFGGGGRQPDVYHGLGTLTQVAKVTRLYAYRKTREPDGTTAYDSTRNLTMYAIHPPTGKTREGLEKQFPDLFTKPTPEDEFIATAAREWARGLDPANDFEWNLHAAAKAGDYRVEQLGIVGYLPTAFQREFDKQRGIVRAARNPAPPDSGGYLGEVGKNISIEDAEVIWQFEREGYMPGTVSYGYKFRDPQGNIIMWWKSNGPMVANEASRPLQRQHGGTFHTGVVEVGDRVSIKTAKVKDHSEYKGQKQTVVSGIRETGITYRGKGPLTPTVAATPAPAPVPVGPHYTHEQYPGLRYTETDLKALEKMGVSIAGWKPTITPVAKHPGPDGSELHSTGSSQAAHSGDGEPIGMVPRHLMPQVPKQHKDDFYAALAAEGKTVAFTAIPAAKIEATQQGLDGDKVISMAERMRRGELLGAEDRLTISSDGYLLDGHHRWAAGKALDMTLPVARVPMTMEELLPWARRWVMDRGVEWRRLDADAGRSLKAPDADYSKKPWLKPWKPWEKSRLMGNAQWPPDDLDVPAFVEEHDKGGGCDDIAQAVEEEWDLPMVEGRFDHEYHVFNWAESEQGELPAIVDFSRHVFDHKEPRVTIVTPDDPDWSRYSWRYSPYGTKPDDWDTDEPPDPEALSRWARGRSLGMAYGDKMPGSTPGTFLTYHLTDNPNFALDPEYEPDTNALTISGSRGKGLYVATDLGKWVNGYDYVRPFVVELEVPDKPRDGRWSGEDFIPASEFPEVKVTRVIPIDEWVHEQFYESGWIESWEGKAQKYPKGYRYAGPDVREMSAAEHKRQAERARRYLKEVRYIDITGKEKWDGFRWRPVSEYDEESGRWIAKHAGPDGSQTHSTGTDQSAHGGKRDLDAIVAATEETRAALNRLKMGEWHGGGDVTLAEIRAHAAKFDFPGDLPDEVRFPEYVLGLMQGLPASSRGSERISGLDPWVDDRWVDYWEDQRAEQEEIHAENLEYERTDDDGEDRDEDDAPVEDLFWFANRPSTVQVRVDLAGLEGLIEHGRLMTQYEAGRSGGFYDPAQRLEREDDLFNGMVEGAAPWQRPVYGYLSEDPEKDYLIQDPAKSGRDTTSGALRQYGSFAIVLKDKVKDRTTWTHGDSMDLNHAVRYGDDQRARPSLVRDPQPWSMSFEDMEVQPPGLFRMGYYEAQIHGGVASTDISHIIIPSEPPEEISTRIAARGIRVGVLDEMADRLKGAGYKVKRVDTWTRLDVDMAAAGK